MREIISISIFATAGLFCFVAAIIAFLGKGKRFFIGKEGTPERKKYIDKKYLSTLGLFWLFTAIIYGFGAIGEWVGWDTGIWIIYIMWGPMFVSWGFDYVQTHKKFRRNPEIPDPPEENIDDEKVRKRGYFILGLVVLMPVLILLSILM
ncbi:MAG: hypothetical protein FWC07_08350 [Defluviitaleaceae bacterium]|nr:hypothetical protein [Defluviitaleaceae bacterium]